MSNDTGRVSIKSRSASRSPTAVKVPKAAELVAKELRNQIVRGSLKIGDSLTAESQLMARFGVSRPTLREAIRILESEGLVEIARGARGGASVLSPSIDVAARRIGFILEANGTTLTDIYRVHMLVEPVAVRTVADNSYKTAPKILRECVEEIRAQIGQDFAYGVATAHFRNTLIELANVPTLTLLMGMINRIFELSWGSLAVSGGRLLDNEPVKRRGLRSMEKLIEYVEAADGEGAETYWRQHTEAVGKALDKWMPATRVVDLLDG
jgi:DNA-binding FadR family transcriptional regulator